MVGDASSMTPLIIAALVAILTTASVLLLHSWWRQRSERRRVMRHLRQLAEGPGAGGPSTQEIFRKTGAQGARWLQALARGTPFLGGSELLLEQAGLAWSQSALTMLTFGCGFLGATLALLFGWAPLVVLAAFLAGAMMPRLFVLRQRTRRLRTIEQQLPDAIDLLGRSIRAGHAVSTGLRTVAEEARDPLASEFRRVFEEQRYGLPFEESLLSLARRVDLMDMRVMVVAVLVQREVGGNLAEILDKIAGLIRVRFTLRRQLRVYTAQGRLSGLVLGLLPPGVGTLLYLINPEYIGVLFSEPAGKIMLGAGLVMQLVGYFWISRIVKIEF